MDYEALIQGCAYKLQDDLTPEELEAWTYERARCQLSLLRFLKWVKVIVPPIPGESRTVIIPLDMRPHLKKIVATLLTKNLISVLKARQIWISTITAAYVTWYALSKMGANSFLFSQGQDAAKELLLKCRNIYDYLPNFLKFELDPDSTEAIGFAPMKSIIKAFPSTASAGISYTASIIVWDEHAKHEYADQNYTHAKPIIDRGAQAISIFTADPFGNDNLATSLFQGALDGKNGYTPLFFPYDVVPGRDDKWYEDTKKSIPDRELSGLGPDLYMAKNYPGSIEEALSLAQDVRVFEKQVLDALKEETRFPLILSSEEFDSSVCNIYKDYHVGNFYIAGSDVGQGLGGDYSVTAIMDVKTGNVVADIMRNDLKPDVFAYHSVQLLKHYQNPKWWIEHNITGGGRDVIKKAVELGYRKLGYRGDKPILWSEIDDNEVLKRVGFFTSEKDRMDLFGQLIPATNNYQLRIYSKEGLKQFYGIIRNSRKQGKIEATGGQHDDYVIAVGICWLKRGDVRTEFGQVKPIETLTFRKEHPDVIEKILARAR